MNEENILKVADAIERHSIPDLGFNMELLRGAADERYPDLSGHNCGTVACIAGWALAVAGKDGGFEAAAEFFGFKDQEEEESYDFPLFFPGSPHYGTTSSQAVAVLRHLAETGEVDWSIT